MSAKDRAFDRQLSREDHQDVLGNPDSSWRTPGRIKREEKLVLLDKILKGIDRGEIDGVLNVALLNLSSTSEDQKLRAACEAVSRSLLAIGDLYENPREIRKIAPKLRESLLEGYAVLIELGFTARPSFDK